MEKDLAKELLKAHYTDKKVMLSFGKVTEVTTIFTLVNLLEDEEVGARAAIILGKIKSEKSFSPLMNALTRGSPNARRNAAWALGELGDAQAVPALVEIIENKYSDVNLLQNAVQALGKIKSVSAITPLIKALENKDIRWSAAQALGEIGSKEVLRALLNNIEHENRGIRLGVTWALHILKSERTIMPLIRALDDEDEEVAKGAAWALQQFTSEEALSKLAEGFIKSTRRAREHITYIFRKIGTKNTIKELHELSLNVSEEIRCDIERAIKAIKER